MYCGTAVILPQCAALVRLSGHVVSHGSSLVQVFLCPVPFDKRLSQLLSLVFCQRNASGHPLVVSGPVANIDLSRTAVPGDNVHLLGSSLLTVIVSVEHSDVFHDLESDLCVVVCHKFLLWRLEISNKKAGALRSSHVLSLQTSLLSFKISIILSKQQVSSFIP